MGTWLLNMEVLSMPNSNDPFDFAAYCAETLMKIHLRLEQTIENSFRSRVTRIVSDFKQGTDPVYKILHRGYWYPTSLVEPKGLKSPTFSFSTMEGIQEMDQAVLWRNNHLSKHKKVMQLLGRLAAEARDPQQLRDCLPDAVISRESTPDLARLSRSVGWLSNVSNPLLVTQARPIADDIDYLIGLEFLS